ncbi:MAG: tetratricopeptide repeat protein [Planctomycetaceae bacterium]|nr:tetratricopeptide repeat protein [Planctomycetaceae bacterium]
MSQDPTIQRALADANAGRIDEGVAALRALLRRKPQDIDALSALARLHALKGEHEQSVQQLVRAVVVAPKNAGCRINLGYAMMNARRNGEAVKSFREALALDPRAAGAWLGLALACSTTGDSRGALEACEKGLAVAPGWPDLVRCQTAALEQADRLEDAVRVLRSFVERAPHDVAMHSRYLLALNYLPLPAEEIAAAHRRFRQAASAPPRPPSLVRDPERPLRVGVLSGDLRTHSVGYFAEPFMRAKPAGGALVVFSTHPPSPNDAMEQAFRALADEWVECAAMDDAALDQAIRARKIDVLVELGGHTPTSRLSALDQKPAPVVVTAIGYPNTTGHAAVDWRVVDSTTDPVGSEPLATERLLRIDPCFLCYEPPRGAPEPAVPPTDAPVTFGSFNLTTKISAQTIALWRRVLDAVPGSRLLLKAKSLGDDAARAGVLARLAAGGIDASRVETIAFTPSVDAHLALYGRVHVALDTVPYNGTTTTCEALWMGVPVVVLEGDRHASRVGASLLRAAGVPELVARDDDAFVDIAVRLASDRAALESMRRGLRARVAASPLLDRAAYGARFHEALRTAWRAWCSGDATGGRA